MSRFVKVKIEVPAEHQAEYELLREEQTVLIKAIKNDPKDAESLHRLLSVDKSIALLTYQNPENKGK